MADRNQLKIDRDDYDFAESDPLAELTRIMGFDPRVEPAPAIDEDFGIDLERELMGEFEEDLRGGEAVEAPSSAPEAGQYEAAVEPGECETEPGDADAGFDEALAASLEEEFSAGAEPWRPDATEAQATSFWDEAAGRSAAGAEVSEVDIDLSGQLSPVADEQAELAAERFLQETAAADEVPDLEAELGELLLSLGAPHGRAGEAPAATAPAAEPAAAEPREEHTPSLEPHAVVENASPPAVDAQPAGETDEASDFVDFAGEEYSPPATIEDETPGAHDTSQAADGPQDAVDDVYVGETEESSATAEPHDNVLDQLFAPAAREAQSDEGEGDPFLETSMAVDLQDAAPLAANGEPAEARHDYPEDSYPEDSIADDPLPEPADPAFDASAPMESSAPFSMEAGQEVEESLLDETEFEAALAGEFALEEFEPEQADDRHLAQEAEDAGDDPFAALSSMGLSQVAHSAADAADPDLSVEESAAHLNAGEPDVAAPDTAAAPFEIETVEVPEQAVALADDLELPDLGVQDHVPAAVAFDDFEVEFANAFNGMDLGGQTAGEQVSDEADESDSLNTDFEAAFQLDGDGFGMVSDQGTQPASPDHDGGYGEQASTQGFQPAYAEALAGSQLPYGSFEAEGGEAFSYDPTYEEGLSELPADNERRQGGNRGFAVAAVVAGLAFVGGIGAFAYSMSGDADAPPALVKADNTPVKVRPENPGGAVVPNQDNKVYERVSGGPLDAPSQETLISGAEEPIELATRAAPADPAVSLPGVDLAPAQAAPAGELSPKAEDRIEPTDIETVIANDEIAAVTPRRVRTMIVRPDGTLVPREDPEPAATEPQQPEAGAEAGRLEEPAAPAPALAPISATSAEPSVQPAVINAEPAAAASPAAAPADEASGSAAPLEAAAQPVASVAEGEAATPLRVPVAPSRPGDQPVDIVGEVRAADKMAVLAQPEPAAPAAAESGWSIQISSQPSQESAQSSYVDLARRYGSILGGRSVNIVKAEIAGKGTFWRVRIPASSRSDAIDLCERYKGAGGSCFVAQ